MPVAAPILKAPFPWFGGKSRVASAVWERFGDVCNYVEPFAGSLAVLLGRPTPPGIETVNDLDKYLANFWRAVAADPDGVAAAADWPVNETDLEARHAWLVGEGAQKLSRIMADPRGYDAEIAGWWVWGLSCWIGSGWCDGRGPWRVEDGEWVHRNAGKGVKGKIPHLSDAGKGVADYLRALQQRFRRVRVCCGDWQRVLRPSVTFRHGVTAVFLDPPYGPLGGDVAMDYAAGGNATDDLPNAVHAWALANADNPKLRIALCGYEGQYKMPADWHVVAWKANGGYSSAAAVATQAKANCHRERVWFSPHCRGSKTSLFDDAQELAAV